MMRARQCVIGMRITPMSAILGLPDPKDDLSLRLTRQPMIAIGSGE